MKHIYIVVLTTFILLSPTRLIFGQELTPTDVSLSISEQEMQRQSIEFERLAKEIEKNPSLINYYRLLTTWISYWTKATVPTGIVPTLTPIKPSLSPVNGCIDSDGRNYLSKGKVTGGNNDCADKVCYDVCYDGRTYGINGYSLVEWYCDTNQAKSEMVKCPDACQNGECLASLPSSTPLPVNTSSPVPNQNITKDVFFDRLKKVIGDKMIDEVLLKNRKRVSQGWNLDIAMTGQKQVVWQKLAENVLNGDQIRINIGGTNDYYCINPPSIDASCILVDLNKKSGRSNNNDAIFEDIAMEAINSLPLIAKNMPTSSPTPTIKIISTYTPTPTNIPVISKSEYDRRFAEMIKNKKIDISSIIQKQPVNDAWYRKNGDTMIAWTSAKYPRAAIYFMVNPGSCDNPPKRTECYYTIYQGRQDWQIPTDMATASLVAIPLTDVTTLTPTTKPTSTIQPTAVQDSVSCQDTCRIPKNSGNKTYYTYTPDCENGEQKINKICPSTQTCQPCGLFGLGQCCSLKPMNCCRKIQ